jgi:hypothetical protein
MVLLMNQYHKPEFALWDSVESIPPVIASRTG